MNSSLTEKHHARTLETHIGGAMIGREITAAGLGLDIVGALYLALGVLRTPMAIASVAFADEDERAFSKPGDRHISLEPLSELAEISVAGRLGAGFLFCGFSLQLIGMFVPARPASFVSPVLTAIAAAVFACAFGRRWLRRETPAMLQAILRSPRITEAVSLKAIRQLPATVKWRESRLAGWLRRSLS